MLRVKKRKVYPKEERGKGMVTKLKPNETASIEYRRGIYYVRIKNESRTIAEMELSPIGSDSHWLDWWTGRECLDEYSETYLEVGPEKSQADHGYGPLMYDIALEYAYQIGTGIYNKKCGLENLKISFGHDEYLYLVLKNNKNHKLSKKYWNIIRFHSFYPWHTGKAYQEFMTEEDEKLLEEVLDFNQFDLYSKEDIDFKLTDEIKEYYQNLLDKYFPEDLQW